MDFSWIQDWLSLLFRWLHFITGAAWIGTSFYFNWLNHNIRPSAKPEDQEKGLAGEVWAIHGGGFYHVQKYQVAPKELPQTLHWFKWEAYFTLITGLCLLSLVYYFGSSAQLIHPDYQATLSHTQGILIGISVLITSWLYYHLLCSSPIAKNQTAIFVLVLLWIAGLAYALSHVFTGRAAYMHIGALIGTIMALNVFFVIIPSQKVMVEQMIAGQVPDPSKGKAGAQRSLHNNYFTLPVLLIMISNHYPHTYGNTGNWWILIALCLIGAGTRHYFNLKNKGENAVWILPLAAFAMFGLAFITQPSSVKMTTALPKQGQILSDQALLGKEVFLKKATPQCGICHRLEDAQTVGIVGPILNVLKPSKDRVINAVTNGIGAMPAQSTLSKQEIDDLAQYVYEASRLPAVY
jgi:uncharacterized membrane protein